jgi:hypothetical protein
MLLDDDVVADGKAKAGAFSGRLGREERVEHLFLHVRRHTGAVVANPDFNTIPKVLGRGRESRLVVATISLCSAPGRSIEAVCNQIKKSPPDVLRENVCPTGRRIKDCLSLISKPRVSARAPCHARLRLSSTSALISITRCSPEPSRECCRQILAFAPWQMSALVAAHCDVRFTSKSGHSCRNAG